MHTAMRKIIAVFVSGLMYLHAIAQPGNADTTFITGWLADADVRTVQALDGGQYLISGSFRSFNNTRSTVIKLNSDFTVDHSFYYQAEVPFYTITTAKMRSDGKVIAGMNYFYDDVPSVIRLNSDGSVDPTFTDPFTGFEGGVYDIEMLPDGKLLVSGEFSLPGSPERTSIVRLFPDGTIDTGFETHFDGDQVPGISITLTADNKILMRGDFLSYNGDFSRKHLMRLLADGATDETFGDIKIVTGAAAIYALAIQADGKIMIAGDFSKVNTTTRHKIARLNSDGTVDLSFNPGSGFQSDDAGFYGTRIYGLAVQADGKILASGVYDTYNGAHVPSMIRLNAGGTLDASFDAGDATDMVGDGSKYVRTILPLDDRIIIGGNFREFGGYKCPYMGQLETDGELSLFLHNLPGFNNVVNKVLVDADDLILAGGNFTRYGNIPVSFLTRMLPDGSIDPAFHVTINNGIDMNVRDLALQPDGKIIAGGKFNIVNGVSHQNLVRLNANGTNDELFNTASLNWVHVVRYQPDGKIFICHDFAKLKRLNANGTNDPSFSGGIFNDINTPQIHDVVLTPDGKYIVGGEFISYNGSSASRVVKLNADGSIDPTFTSPVDAGSVSDIELLADGDMIVTGNFSLTGGPLFTGVARFHPDGSVDAGFHNAVIENVDNVHQVISIDDEKLILGGEFSEFDGYDYNGIVCIDADNGGVDASVDFQNPATWNGYLGEGMFSFGEQGDGKLIVAGTFYSFGVTRDYIARIYSPIGCIAPDGLFADHITATKAKIHWNEQASAESYQVWYRAVGAGTWLKKSSATNFKTIKSLLPETDYEYKVRSKCSDGEFTDFSSPENFTTLPLRSGEIQNEFIVNVYPNPADNLLFIETSGSEEIILIEIYDVMGNRINAICANPENDVMSLDISFLAKGMYFLHVSNSSENKIIQFIHQ